ncbi:MAG: hypothetical protein ACREIH_00030 [Nitrospiraceae bacterium]
MDLYTHGIEQADRGSTREVDLLVPAPDGGTFGGTQTTMTTEALKKTGE